MFIQLVRETRDIRHAEASISDNNQDAYPDASCRCAQCPRAGG